MMDVPNFEELERRVNAGEMSFNEAMVYVAATTGQTEGHDVTSELHAALCALEANHLVPIIRLAEAKVNDQIGLIGFAMHITGDVNDIDNAIIAKATKAVLEAGAGGKIIDDFDFGEVMPDGQVMLSGKLRHDDWEDAIRDFKTEIDSALDPPTNQQGQEGPNE